MRTGARVAAIALQSALVGSIYGAIRGGPFVGAAIGAGLGGALSFLEIVVFQSWWRPAMMRLPFALYFALRVAIYFGLILALDFGALAAAGLSASVLEPRDLAFNLIVAMTANVVISVNELLGPGVMFAVAAGRYRRPRRERRVLFFADLAGSTALAERLGEERFLDLLNAYFADLSQAVAREGAAIHKYVGDELIATWPAGADPARPIRACFDARRRIAARAAWYRATFGDVPAFRAALHEGPVVIGELGVTRKEIALIGDAMNVCARLLEAAREANAFALVSGPLYDRLAAPVPGWRAQRLAPLTPRGKSTPLDLVSLDEE